MLIFLVGCNGEGLQRDNFRVNFNKGGGTDNTNKIVRPSNAILIKSDFCACNGGKQVTYGNCTNFCASTSTVQSTFYGSVNVTEDVSLSAFQNLDGWCNKVDFGLEENSGILVDETPSCSLVFEKLDQLGTTYKSTIQITGTAKNSFQAILPSQLEDDTTYRTYLLFEGAGSNNVSGLVESSKVQIQLLPDQGPEILNTPLEMAGINRYACIKAAYVASQNSNIIFNDEAIKQYFFYAPSYSEPTPIPFGTIGFYCHDQQIYGANDNVLYPRLDLAPGAFSVWNRKDPRFYDLVGQESDSPSDTNMDIYNLIVKKLADLGVSINGGAGQLQSSNFFVPFQGFGDPGDSAAAGNNPDYYGYYMQPQIDKSTGLSFCPDSEEYNGDNPFFNVLGDIFNQLDTEGFYVGQQIPDLVLTDANGVAISNICWPIVYLTETELKRVWFYLDNGIPTPANETTVKTKTVYFYWPLTPSNGNPLVKQGDQKIYQLKLPAAIADSCNTATSNNSNTPPTSLDPHDKKIGCIPKTN